MMKTPKTIVAALLSLLLVAAVLLAVGCGGGDTALTKAEFIKQADLICQKAEKKKAKATEAFLLKTHAGPGNPLTHAQLEYQTKKLVMPPIRSATQEINELGAPDGEEKTISTLIKSLEQASDKAEKRAEEPNPASGDSYTQAAKLAREYGFKTCFIYY